MLEDVKKVSIKEAFRTETKFTAFIADNEEVGEMLIAKAGYGGRNFSNYRITDNDPLKKSSKRPDNVVYNEDLVPSKPVLVIEAQLGALDEIHASKILLYAFGIEDHRDDYVEDCILLCESASPFLKDFIYSLNKNTPHNIWIMVPEIIGVNNEFKIIDFEVILEPEGLSRKNITVNKKSSTSGVIDNREWAVEFAKKHLKWKLNPCKSWVNTINYFSEKDTKYNVTLLKDPGNYKAQFEYRTNSRGRYNRVMLDEDIISTVKEVFEDNNIEMVTGTKSKVYGNFDTIEDAWEMYKKITNGVEGNINLNNRKGIK
tara:strand:- start:831 stop:1775 length:945 start_codon:yes stop_codon:yes gene_type:complete